MRTDTPRVDIITPTPISVQPPDLVRITISKELAAGLVGILSCNYVVAGLAAATGEHSHPTQASTLREQINNRLWGGEVRTPIGRAINTMHDAIKEAYQK